MACTERSFSASRQARSVWRRPLYRWFCAAVGLLMAIAATSCQGLFQTEAAQIPQLVISELSDPKTFNYVTKQEVTAIYGLMYEGLLRENGVTGELELAQAENMEISEDNRRVVFTLREGLRWSDGEPFTADDIVFTYNEL